MVERARINGIDLAFERRGSGPPLLFCNGSGATVATAGMLIDPYTARFEVVVHDQRGLGETGVPPGPYEMADYAADALGLLDHLGWATVRVVGVSFGGMVAQELAVTAPERVERLALVCTSPGGAYASYPLHTLADLDPEERAEVGITLMDTRFTPEWLADHELDRLMAEYATRPDPETDPVVLEGKRLQLDARSRHDVVDRLGVITCPTFVASGRFDGIAPPANGAAIAERIPGARFEIFEGGHGFFAQDPAALPAVLDFLAGDAG